MTYSLPSLRALTPAQLTVLNAQDTHVKTVRGQHPTLPDAVEFRLSYCGCPGTPLHPKPAIRVTLYPAQGQYAVALSVTHTGDESRPQHDDPVTSPALAEAMVQAVLTQARITLAAEPEDKWGRLMDVTTTVNPSLVTLHSGERITVIDTSEEIAAP